ncbi:hypothetical protein [Pengzhenrongella frigida]|uniref:Uncharacterized protein n=1 Tax=Pengzhenrongella frigida TaxID=1259133 RepID=A0A4Q5MYU1_9MICO|nr:hypothetical protein [Cellulomonas sp. HLT2-17]RYV50860.1 hypothetical protein EUA98_11370 [Cellulomonas sp. HLT2-17]
MAGPDGVRRRGLLLRWGLPRDEAGGRHVAGFFVSAVVTVLLVRLSLAALGYPQLGGGGLHVAHVLWGGLLMALAFVLLLSFAGPVVRPVGALVGGVGFGLFIDEIGKFVTSDNDYFYEPTASLIYLVVVALLLVSEGVQGRRPPHASEALAGAVDLAVAGVAGGFSTRARRRARDLVSSAGPVAGAGEVRALLDVVESDADELPDPIGAVASWVVRATRLVVRARWAPWVAVGVLSLAGVATVGRGLVVWVGGSAVPGWVVGALVVSGGVSVLFVMIGAARVRGDRLVGYVWFRRAVLVSLLVTQVAVFRLDQWAAMAGVVVDLAVLGVVGAELNVMRAAGRGSGTGAPVR